MLADRIFALVTLPGEDRGGAALNLPCNRSPQSIQRPSLALIFTPTSLGTRAMLSPTPTRRNTAPGCGDPPAPGVARTPGRRAARGGDDQSGRYPDLRPSRCNSSFTSRWISLRSLWIISTAVLSAFRRSRSTDHAAMPTRLRTIAVMSTNAGIRKDCVAVSALRLRSGSPGCQAVMGYPFVG